jgi:hypothetical protein
MMKAAHPDMTGAQILGSIKADLSRYPATVQSIRECAAERRAAIAARWQGGGHA